MYLFVVAFTLLSISEVKFPQTPLWDTNKQIELGILHMKMSKITCRKSRKQNVFCIQEPARLANTLFH